MNIHVNEFIKKPIESYENWKLKMGDKNTNITKFVIILFLWEGNKSTKNLSSIGQTKRRKLLWKLLLLLLQLLCIICMSQLLEHLITKIAAKIEKSFQEDDQGRGNIYL